MGNIQKNPDLIGAAVRRNEEPLLIVVLDVDIAELPTDAGSIGILDAALELDVHAHGVAIEICCPREGLRNCGELILPLGHFGVTQ